MRKKKPEWGVNQHARIGSALRAMGYDAPSIGITGQEEALKLIADALEDISKRVFRKLTSLEAKMRSLKNGKATNRRRPIR